MAAAITARPVLRTSQTQPLPTAVCPQCGIALPHLHDDITLSAQKRIAELEGQVKVLTSKATEAVDKLADNEDELRRLKSATPQDVSSGDAAKQPSINNPSALQRSSSDGDVSSNPDSKSTPARPQHTRFPPLFNYRRAASSSNTTTVNSNANPTSDPSPQQTSEDNLSLRNALAQEKDLRMRAESKVTQVNSELEELSAQLFQQANEMVSVERRARAQLEERLSSTEQRLKLAEETTEQERTARAGLQQRVKSAEERIGMLEKREVDKKGRLERLERAVGRIEKVRGILQVT